METCSVDSCDSPVFVKKRQLCKLHYHRFARHGDPEAFKRKQRSYCSADGCDLPVVGSGLCDLHYRRLRRYGTTDAPVRPVSCSVEGCLDPVQAKEMCERHYRRQHHGLVAEDRSCRQCGVALDSNAHAKRVFCSARCKEDWAYHDRKDKYREVWLRQYGLTVEDYEAMSTAQGGGCALCGTTTFTGRGKRLVVDHDHVTGKVRGLLCHDCNTGLGKFKDDPELLRRAIAYLG